MTGDIYVNQGVLQFTADNNLGAAGNNVRLLSSTLNYAGTSDLTTDAKLRWRRIPPVSSPSSTSPTRRRLR